LADAMEGPTPVSALIHAATMVTAGVFLIIRCSYLFEYSLDILLIIGIIGSLTCFFSATIGIVQNDIKKIIAFSTCSQLGYMIFSCGLSSYHISFFHLINHAFFKALLFLTSGIIIHAFNNEQDMRKMGGVLKLLPCSYSFMLIGSLALAGFPFLSGFYSKDIILEISYTKYKLVGLFSYFLGSLSAFFTAFYSMRLLLLTFFVKSNSFRYNLIKIHEGNKILIFFLLILVFGSLFSGYLFKDLFIGFGAIFFNNSINILGRNSINFEIEFLPLYIKLFPTFFSLTGFLLAFYFYQFSFYNLPRSNFLLLYWFLSKK
jgi:NADH:ubiquinone oxidoreductase subunit 5 (subunit L)/multisubunit Na+/H+ antiporter MnhA subunit